MRVQYFEWAQCKSQKWRKNYDCFKLYQIWQKKEFNDILFNEVMPAYYAYKDSSAEKNKLNDRAAKSMRILLPVNMNKDST